MALLKSFRQIGNLIYLLVLIISCVYQDPERDYQVGYLAITLPIIFNALVQIVTDLILVISWNNNNYSTKLDQQQIIKVMFSRGLQVTQVRSIDLGIGDIIILKKDDPVTVDILVLECKDENCVISTNQVDGLINFSIRHPVNLAAIEKQNMKQALNYYRVNLNGIVEYNEPERNSKMFKGYIKLTNDPKRVNVEFNNIILKGSQLKNTDWIVGLVISKGKTAEEIMTAAKDIQPDASLAYNVKKFILFSCFWLIAAVFILVIWRF